ncbi:MAG: class I SAM-dependent methyltransferase [Candidatus Latescibacteria bacterium]|nr:class I SAM-dependent methyltransferase [Candidatus Latescibacterota bacterium]
MNHGFGNMKNFINGMYKNSSGPYSELAVIYDSLMDHVDYSSWAKYISSIFERFTSGVVNVLEIAGGTGSLSVELHKYGYSMTCMDYSHSMLKSAVKKFYKASMPLNIITANMTSLPLNFHYDAVLCLYDSINYLIKPEDFIRTLHEVASILTDDGIFVFDVCTVKNSELFFRDTSMVEHIDDIVCERICKFNRRKRIQENHFILERPGQKKIKESHYQKIYMLDEIGEMISDSPFIELSRFDDTSFVYGTEESERVHFVLRKRVLTQ